MIASSLLALLLPLPLPQGEGRTSLETPVVETQPSLFERWRAAEDRWGFFEEHVPGEGREFLSFLQALADAGEDAFLEELVRYHTWGPFPLQKLEAMDSPRWLRAADWSLNCWSGGAWGGAETLLRKRAPLALAWAERFPAAREVHADFYGRLAELTSEREDAARFLPPAAFEDVFAELFRRETAPQELESEPASGRLERELKALHTLRRIPVTWSGALLELTDHPSADVRLLVYDALAKMREDTPVVELFERVDDAARLPEERVAALRAASHGPRPAVVTQVLAYALQPEHPARLEALERLATLGGLFALESLQAQRAAFSGEAAVVLARTIAAIEGRWERPMDDAHEARERVREVLEEAAWADLACHPRESDVVAWMQRTCAQWKVSSTALEVLRELAEGYEPGPGVHIGTLPNRSEEFRRRVRSYAARLLE